MTVVGSPPGTNHSTTRFVRLAHLHKLRECEQVAAICYRVRSGEIEFLLVRTRRSGRWTFPKGSAEPGLTHAQAAALEAFEEAGVHGRIEETSFTRYICRKRRDGRKSGTMSAKKGLAVNAHLCQVLRLGKPKESDRDRTWFSVKDARRSLREGRERDDGAELARVVDKAVARIQRLRSGVGIQTDYSQHERPRDGLQKVQFEAAAELRMTVGESFSPYMRGRRGEMRQLSMQSIAPPRELQGEVLQFSPAREKKD